MHYDTGPVVFCSIAFGVEAVIGYADFLSCMEKWRLRAEWSILMTLERETENVKKRVREATERENKQYRVERMHKVSVSWGCL